MKIMSAAHNGQAQKASTKPLSLAAHNVYVSPETNYGAGTSPAPSRFSRDNRWLGTGTDPTAASARFREGSPQEELAT